MMEFHEKLQELRKQAGLTQEELAQALFVSRAAVSKWESGRGYPNIDSLKAIAKHFGVTVDELLSCDEILSLAQEDQKQKANRFRDLLFGLLDISTALLYFLPFFCAQNHRNGSGGFPAEPVGSCTLSEDQFSFDHSCHDSLGNPDPCLPRQLRQIPDGSSVQNLCAAQRFGDTAVYHRFSALWGSFSAGLSGHQDVYADQTPLIRTVSGIRVSKKPPTGKMQRMERRVRKITFRRPLSRMIYFFD